MKASDILRLLKCRHSKDLFVSECKNGPTHYSGNLLKLDAWAMKRSWANPCYYGYEIKVSRGDFLRDEKWRGYMPLCNMLYFVCPSGVIQKEEVPDGCGLVVVSKGGGTLLTKKRARHRDIDQPIDLLLYVLMCRVKVGVDLAEGSNADYWRRWLEEKAESREIGHRVSRALADRFREEVFKVQSENKALEKRMESYESMQRFLVSMGMDANHTGYYAEQQLQQKVKEAGGEQLVRSINSLIRQMRELRDQLKGDADDGRNGKAERETGAGCEV